MFTELKWFYSIEAYVCERIPSKTEVKVCFQNMADAVKFFGRRK